MSYFTRQRQHAITQVARADQAALIVKAEQVEKGGPGSGPHKGGGKVTVVDSGKTSILSDKNGKHVGWAQTRASGKGGDNVAAFHTARDPDENDIREKHLGNFASHEEAIDAVANEHANYVGKTEKLVSRLRTPLIKDDSAPMQQTSTANQASSDAYQASAPPQQAAPADPEPAPTPTPVNDQIKAHKTAAAAHGDAAKAHRVAGKACMQATPTVGAAHYQQAQAHDQAQYSHASQAQSLQDAKDQGYR